MLAMFLLVIMVCGVEPRFDDVHYFVQLLDNLLSVGGRTLDFQLNARLAGLPTVHRTQAFDVVTSGAEERCDLSQDTESVFNENGQRHVGSSKLIRAKNKSRHPPDRMTA